MTNKYADHLLVLPEDDANRRLVNAFLQAEWPLVHESAARAESMAHTDPQAACFYARRMLAMAVAWQRDALTVVTALQACHAGSTTHTRTAHSARTRRNHHVRPV